MLASSPGFLKFGGEGFIPKEASNYVLEQACGLLFHKLADHVAKYGADSVEAFIGSTNVVEPIIVEKNLLNYENGDGLGQLRASFHDSKT